jgi:hypothetical protein
MLVYIVPIIVFILCSFGLYSISNDKTKSKPKTIFIRNILPASVVSLLVFLVIKFKDSHVFNNEPLMQGNFFD